MDASIPRLLPRKNGTLFERWWRVNERANAAEKTEGEPLVKSSGPFVSQAAGKALQWALQWGSITHPRPSPRQRKDLPFHNAIATNGSATSLSLFIILLADSEQQS
jgi:hypothetical protein